MSPGGKKRRAEAKLVLPSILRARPEVEEGRDEDSSGTEDVGGDIFNGSNNSQRVEKRLESLEKAVKNLVDKNESLERAVKNLVDNVGEGAKPTQKYPECPVCLEDIIQDTRIMMCPAGHLLCGGCHDKMEDKICPSCQKLIIGRCHGMETYLRDMMRGMGRGNPGEKSMAMMNSMQPDTEPETEAVIMRKLFVRNLNSNVTEEKIRTYFSEFGEIEFVKLPAHSDSGKIKGFAFVTFKESSSVDAVQMARPHRLAGTQLETTRARSRDRDFRGQAPYFGAVSSSGGYSGYGGQGQGGYSGFSGYSSLGQTWSSVQGGAAQGGGGPLRRHQRDTRGANPYDPYNRQ